MKISTPTMSMSNKSAVGIKYGEDNDEPGDNVCQVYLTGIRIKTGRVISRLKP